MEFDLSRKTSAVVQQVTMVDGAERLLQVQGAVPASLEQAMCEARSMRAANPPHKPAHSRAGLREPSPDLLDQLCG